MKFFSDFRYANNHNYTTNVGEKNYLISLGWNDEGIAWYGVNKEEKKEEEKEEDEPIELSGYFGKTFEDVEKQFANGEVISESETDEYRVNTEDEGEISFTRNKSTGIIEEIEALRASSWVKDAGFVNN